MIRINLLRDVGSGEVASTGGSADIGGVDAVDSFEPSRYDLGFKIFLLIVPIILMFGYRQFLVSRAESERARLLAQQTQLDAKLKSYDVALKDIEKFEEEKRKLDSQLAIIKALSKERLKIVKSLDALQMLIPNAAWLESLTIKGDKVEMAGLAINDIIVSEFMQQLSSSIYFGNIVLSGSDEAQTQEGTVKKFMIKSNLENM